jgi:phosphotransferase system HPr-like phosphotransfer protein
MGDSITIHCQGDGCDDAIDQLSALVTERFGED